LLQDRSSGKLHLPRNSRKQAARSGQRWMAWESISRRRRRGFGRCVRGSGARAEVLQNAPSEKRRAQAALAAGLRYFGLHSDDLRTLRKGVERKLILAALGRQRTNVPDVWLGKNCNWSTLAG